MPELTKNISSFTQQDIAYLLKNSHVKARVPGLRVLLAPANFNYGRILIITPRQSGKAVYRNKIRRRLKTIFYEQKLFLHGHDCVVIVKKEGIHTSFENLKKLLYQAFSTINVKQEAFSSIYQS